VCAIKVILYWITSAPLLLPPYITTFLRQCTVQIPLSLPCLCLRAISADQLELVSRLPAVRSSLREERLSLGVASILTGSLLLWTLPSNMRM
jgi:hypothetical protein